MKKIMKRTAAALLILAAVSIAAIKFFEITGISKMIETVSLKSDNDEDAVQQSIAAKILRFHVLANSDSEEDQKLKLSVRDAVGEYIEPYLADASDRSETEEIVNMHLDEIIETAERVVAEAGYSYTVTCELAEVEFPEKTYGDYTFPAGTYEALELVIGEGNGRNWWCVLYPNMCFRGSIYEIVSEDADEALREVLSPEEYEEVFSSDRLEVRFWLWDFLSDLAAEILSNTGAAGRED